MLAVNGASNRGPTPGEMPWLRNDQRPLGPGHSMGDTAQEVLDSAGNPFVGFPRGNAAQPQTVRE